MNTLAIVLLLAQVSADDGTPRVRAGGAAISNVLVYPDGAMVTRRAKVSLPAGRSVVVFEQLAPGLDEASLLAKIATPGAKVTGISADWQGSLEPMRETEAKLTKEIDGLNGQIQAENDKISSLGQRRNLLEQYRAHAREALSQNAGEKSADPKWQAAVAFFTRETDKIAVEERAIQERMEKLNEKLQAANAELGKLRTAEQRKTRRVEVEVEADAATSADIALDYAVGSAGWFPAYDVRHDDGKMLLTYYGTVVQGTGEDWKEVKLTLSTARPSSGAQIPTLTPLMLSGAYREKRPVQIVSYGKKKAKQEEAQKAEQSLAQNVLSGRAALDDKGTAVSFVIDGKETLPADRRPHKVEVSTVKLDSTLSYEAIPKITPFVFLKATAKNTSPFPLLAGAVNVFRSAGYVGTSNVEYIAPGEEFAVSLGVDEELKVRRIIDERVDTKPKLLGSTRSLTYAYSIEVENFKGDAQTVTIVENIPVTQRKEIKVEIREGTTKPDTKDDEGFLKWNVALKPGEKRTVYFGYLVEYPSSFNIGGL